VGLLLAETASDVSSDRHGGYGVDIEMEMKIDQGKDECCKEGGW
jgi:hypothetical protein